MPNPTIKRIHLVSKIAGIKILADGEKRVSDIQIMKTGDFEHQWYGDFAITEKDFDDIIRNFDSGDRDVPIDFNHGSLAMDPEAAKAGGWFKAVFKKDGELWATIEWTDAAVEYIEKDEYRYISPEFEQGARHSETGEKLGTVLYAAALTNRPFLEGMAPVALAEGVDIPELYRPAKPKQRRLKMLSDKRVREILDLSEDTELTDDHRNDAVEKLDARVQELVAGEVELTEASGVDGGVKETVAALKDGKLPGKVILSEADHTKLTDRATKADDLEKGQKGMAKLTETEHLKLKDDAEKGAAAHKALHERDVSDYVANQMREGKILASEKETLVKLGIGDFDTLKTLIDGRPKLVDFGEGGSSEEGTQGDGTVVRQFIEEREIALIAAGTSDKAKAFSLALKEARVKFSTDEIDEYEYPARKAS